MEIKFDVVKILAVGCNKRFMWIHYKSTKYKTLEYDRCVPIDGNIYEMLKEKGVPTSQSMRKKL